MSEDHETSHHEYSEDARPALKARLSFIKASLDNMLPKEDEASFLCIFGSNTKLER